MNNNTYRPAAERPSRRLILNGHWTGITVFGWKNMRAEEQRQAAKGNTVEWALV